MLYKILLNYIEIFTFLNVFKYITFRTGLAFFTSLLDIAGKCNLAQRTQDPEDIRQCLKMEKLLNVIDNDLDGTCASIYT